MKPSIIKYTDYQDNQELIKSIMDLIKPSYKTAGKHIAMDIKICNELYVMQSENGQMLALFMIGYHKIANMTCCYMGLSACRQEHKSSGFVKQLYVAFFKDCLKFERNLEGKVICYGTTATPIVWYAYHRLWNDVEPKIDGSCSEEAKKILSTIAHEKYSHAQFEEKTPFLLRQAAHQINYSDNERQRISKAITDLHLTVFDQYKLDETQGDRFLMFGFCPSIDKIDELIK